MKNASPIRCRSLQYTLAALSVAVLLLPCVQQVTGRPPERRLGGFRYRVREFPPLTVKSWFDKTYASTVDMWFQERVGLRGWMVSLNRQIRYSLFGQAEAAPLRKRALVIGAPPMLYENILLTDALRPPQIPPETLESLAARLAQTQALLRQQGMAFLVIVAPNKALIYTNSLPAWARHRIRDEHTDYKPFVEALERHAVPCLDTMALFRDLSPRFPDLIPVHGIHWGHHGAWIAWQRSVPLVNRQQILPDIPVPQTEELIMDRPSSMSDELRGQLNLFFSRHGAPIPCAYPVAAPLPPGATPMLRVLVVGDSFGFTLMDALSRSRLCQSLNFWFYLRSEKTADPIFDSRERRGISGIRGLGLRRANLEDGRHMLDGKNLVILVMTTFNIDKQAWGLDRVVARVFGDPTGIRADEPAASPADSPPSDLVFDAAGEAAPAP